MVTQVGVWVLSMVRQVGIWGLSMVTQVGVWGVVNGYTGGGLSTVNG